MKEIIYGDIEVFRADREPCVVCGHPTGDCSDNATTKPLHVLGPDAFLSMEHEPWVPVEEDVWQERAISPFTTTRIRVAKAGTAIPLSKAKFLGIVTDDSQF